MWCVCEVVWLLCVCVHVRVWDVSSSGLGDQNAGLCRNSINYKANLPHPYPRPREKPQSSVPPCVTQPRTPLSLQSPSAHCTLIPPRGTMGRAIGDLRDHQPRGERRTGRGRRGRVSDAGQAHTGTTPSTGVISILPRPHPQVREGSVSPLPRQGHSLHFPVRAPCEEKLKWWSGGLVLILTPPTSSSGTLDNWAPLLPLFPHL